MEDKKTGCLKPPQYGPWLRANGGGWREKMAFSRLQNDPGSGADGRGFVSPPLDGGGRMITARESDQVKQFEWEGDEVTGDGWRQFDWACWAQIEWL